MSLTLGFGEKHLHLSDGCTFLESKTDFCSCRNVDQWKLKRRMSNGITGRLISVFYRSYFEKWWNMQTPETHEKVRRLIEKGQLHFVNSGWVMNDEAVTTYQDMIRQMTLGNKFLAKTLNYTTKVGWQIDPFGISATFPALLKLGGYENLVINRVDYRVKNQLKVNKSLEFLWKLIHPLGSEDNTIFTHILHTGYTMPVELFWHTEGNQKKPNHYDNTDSMITTWANTIVNVSKERSKAYQTSHIMLPYGDDFYFQRASDIFPIIERVMGEINSHSSIYQATIKYSNLYDYFETVKAELPTSSLPIRSGDFFPYADNRESYWTGFYTSRSTSKALARLSDAYIRLAELLQMQAYLSTKDINLLQSEELDHLRRWNGIMQHHDAVTGTEKLHVAQDYQLQIARSIDNLDATVTNYGCVSTAVFDNSPSACKQLVYTKRIHYQEEPEKGTLVVTLQNSADTPFVGYVQITVPSSKYEVWDTQQKPIPSEVHRYNASSEYVLFFRAEIPPLGFNTYFLNRRTDITNDTLQHPIEEYKWSNHQEVASQLENDVYALKFDHETGLLESIYHKKLNKVIQLNHGFFNYKDSSYKQKSGAYVFRPAGNATFMGAPVATYIRQGQFIREFRQVYSTNSNVILEQTYRLYNGLGSSPSSSIIEIHTSVQLLGEAQVITRFNTNISNHGVFYTDGNGYQMIQRTFLPEGRPDDADKGASIAGNFYPMTSKAYIRSENSPLQLTLMTSRSHGVSSQGEGSIEIMLHRSLLNDDYRGVNEPLIDKSMSKEIFYMVIDSGHETDIATRDQIHQQLQYHIFPLFTTANSSYEWLAQNYPTSSLISALPPSVHIVSLYVDPDLNNSIVLRLMNTQDSIEVSNPTLVSYNFHKRYMMILSILSIHEHIRLRSI
jgi:lysosomal alpha-mannosidase